ncbi:MAG: hypothetical protein EON60_05860 [Alphaproteobacteria bacterium]|nr:MAG: hypothetical protein EON60_05860 [Alphaproteobacteria bacterium]
MQKNLFALLCVVVFLPSLFALGQNPLGGTLLIPMAAAVTVLYLALIMYHPVINQWLRSPWPFVVMVFGQLMLCLIAKTGLQGFFTPLAFVFAICTLRQTRMPWLQVNRFSLSLYACLLMWPTTGSLLPALGLFIFNIVILLNQHRVRPEETAARALLLGATALAHPLLVALPAIMGFSLLATWPKRAAFIAIFGTAISAAIVYYLPQSQLTSATISQLLPDATTILAAASLLGIVIVQSIYHWRWWPPHQHAAWLLGTLVYVLTLAQLAQTSSFTLWSSAPLLTLALPLVVHTLLRPTYKNR